MFEIHRELGAEVDAVYGHRLLIDKQDQRIGRWVLPPHNCEHTQWIAYGAQETLFWRRSTFKRIGGLDPDLLRIGRR